ncbi:hypothetical protein ACFWBI_09695 [Streptomyces sp. NPDC059982]|uniref:hypothetical protein n=1 Tax=unclassified Streptomyces TaxID=2593676 RepID=UPI00342AE54C
MRLPNAGRRGAVTRRPAMASTEPLEPVFCSVMFCPGDVPVVNQPPLYGMCGHFDSEATT